MRKSLVLVARSAQRILFSAVLRFVAVSRRRLYLGRGLGGSSPSRRNGGFGPLSWLGDGWSRLGSGYGRRGARRWRRSGRRGGRMTALLGLSRDRARHEQSAAPQQSGENCRFHV